LDVSFYISPERRADIDDRSSPLLVHQQPV
jgi:hypothetical protein